MLKPEDIAAIFEWIELLLIASLKRNLAHHKEEEEQEGFTWSAWQAEKLRSINTFRRQCKSIIDRYTDVIDSETRQLLEEQFEEGVNGAAKELEEARAEKAAPAALPAAEGQQTPAEKPEQTSSEKPKESPVKVEAGKAAPAVPKDESSIVAEVTPEPQFFGVDKSKTEKLIEDVANIEKQAETAALRLTDDVYRQTVNRVQLAMATGSISYAKAVDMAVADFLAQGINCIEYKDGRRVNIADYVRMVLRTTSTRAALQGESESWKARGYDTVQVSSYGMCSKTCLPWQGRAYINDAFTDWSGETKLENGIKYGKSNYCGKWFPLLSSAVEHGLFHPNCRHGLGLHIDGVTELPEPMDNSEIERRYKAEQAQRALEREVRKAKRKVEGSLDPADVKKAKAELAEAQKNVRDHINKTNADEGTRVLVRKPLQEKIYGGDVRIGSDADPVYGPKSPPESVPEGYAVDVDVAAPKQSAPAQYADEKIPEKLKAAGVEENKAVEPVAEVEDLGENGAEVNIPRPDDKSQSYRPVVLNEDDEVTTGRDYEVKAYKAENTQNEIYVSENVDIKPRKLHQIDRHISEAIDKMGISDLSNFPKALVVSREDIAKTDIAVYRAIENLLLICEDFAVYKPQDMPSVMKQLACGENDLSSYIHELYHWIDAEEFRSKIGAVTEHNYKPVYMNYVNNKAKIQLDKLSAKGYNILVSEYARKSAATLLFNEIFTEYRTFSLLGGE